MQQRVLLWSCPWHAQLHNNWWTYIKTVRVFRETCFWSTSFFYMDAYIDLMNDWTKYDYSLNQLVCTAWFSFWNQELRLMSGILNGWIMTPAFYNNQRQTFCCSITCASSRSIAARYLVFDNRLEGFDLLKIFFDGVLTPKIWWECLVSLKLCTYFIVCKRIDEVFWMNDPTIIR